MGGAPPLARAAPLIHECLAAWPRTPRGVLLSVRGQTPSLRLRAADHMNFTEGTLWSEPGAGHQHNQDCDRRDQRRAGLRARALQRGRPEGATSSAAPIHDPDTGDLLGGGSRT